MTTYEITFNERSTVGKNILAFLEQNKKYVKINTPTKMTKEEFDAKCNEAREQWKRGECFTFHTNEDVDAFFEEYLK